MSEANPIEICCIGAGRIGVFSMLVLAHRVPNVNITIVDEDQNLINRWLSEELPFYEPDLQHFIQLYRGNKVKFEYNIEGAIGMAEVIFLAIELKTKEEGLGEGGLLEYNKWEKMVLQIRNHAQLPKIVIDKSVVQFGMRNQIRTMLSNNIYAAQHDIFSNPEFFSKGTAFQNLLNPDRVVLGIKTPGSHIEDIMQFYDWVEDNHIMIINNCNGAEVGKFASNIFLGLNGIISNIIASISQKVGVDVFDVTNVVQGDRRLHGIPKPHGVIGGPSLQRDIQFAAYLCEEYNLKEPSQFLKLSIKINKKTKEDFVKKMLEMMVSLKDKVIVVLGFAFKENTNDISDSAALYVCELLLKEKAVVRIVDPWVHAGVIRACFSSRFVNSGKLQVINVNQIAAAWNGADAICVPTRSNFFVPHIVANNMDNMNNPKFFFDLSCNPDYDLAGLTQAGFEAYGFGRLM